MSGIRTAVLLCLSGLMAACGHVNTVPFSIDKVGYFYVGGEKIRSVDALNVGGSLATGSFIIDQVGVTYMIPRGEKPHAAPVIMSPGFGLAGHLYLETADGRPGWAHRFLEAGHPVYILDRSHTARTGLDVTKFNNVRAGKAAAQSQPLLIHWLDEQIWTRWGLGPEFGKEFENGQFPIDSIDQLVSGFTSVPSEGVDLKSQAIGNLEGLTALLEKIGPSILITHSASGPDGFNVAMARPELVQAIITIEPVGCLSNAPKKLIETPILSVFGDNLDVRPQMVPRSQDCNDMTESLVHQGGQASFLDLPLAEIFGNSHIMMSDLNSDQIADKLLTWLSDIQASKVK